MKISIVLVFNFLVKPIIKNYKRYGYHSGYNQSVNPGLITIIGFQQHFKLMLVLIPDTMLVIVSKKIDHKKLIKLTVNASDYFRDPFTGMFRYSSRAVWKLVLASSDFFNMRFAISIQYVFFSAWPLAFG